MTNWKPNPDPPLEFQIVLRARTVGGKWVNVIMTQAYGAGTIADYNGIAIDVDVETVTDRIKRSLAGNWP